MNRKFTEAEYRVFELEAKIFSLRNDIACLRVVNKQKSIAVLEQAIVPLEAEIAALKISPLRNRDCISCGAEVPDSWDTIGSIWCDGCWNHAVQIQDRKIDAELRKVAR